MGLSTTTIAQLGVGGIILALLLATIIEMIRAGEVTERAFFLLSIALFVFGGTAIGAIPTNGVYFWQVVGALSFFFAWLAAFQASASERADARLCNQEWEAKERLRGRTGGVVDNF